MLRQRMWRLHLPIATTPPPIKTTAPHHNTSIPPQAPCGRRTRRILRSGRTSRYGFPTLLSYLIHIKDAARPLNPPFHLPSIPNPTLQTHQLQDVRECANNIKELIKGMKDLCKSTTAMSLFSKSLAKTNKKVADKLAGLATHSEDMEAVPLLHRFANTLGEMASAHDTLVHSLTQSFIVPLETFCAHEADKATEHEKTYQQEKHAFTDALGKLLRGPLKPSTKTPPATTLTTRAREVGQARRGMEQARHRLAHRVDSLEVRRTLELTEGVAAVLFAFQAHHLMLVDSMATLGPSLDELRASQSKAREGLREGEEQWERRAEMLDMLLPTEVAERSVDACDEARLAHLSTVEAAAITPLSTSLLDLVDRKFGVLDVQQSLRTFFMPRAAPGVHHESYLHMRVPTKGLGE